MLLFSEYVTLQFVVSECEVSSRPYFTGITFTFSSPTNKTQISQASKQMEYDNNEH